MEFVFLWLGLAIIIGVAADRRGRSGFGWFFLAVVLSPLLAGLLLLAMGKPQASSNAVVYVPHAAAETHTRRVKTCPDCAEEVLADARICKHCRHDFRPDTSPLSHRPAR